jgi:cytochrome d ubiquinol oxidase subunit I
VVRFSFHAMVAIGTALIALAAIFFWVRFRRGRLPRSRWFWRAAVAAGPASVVALWAGWTTTEVGRQPWIVRDAMRTSEAVTAADSVPVAYVVLALVYLVLAIGAGLALRGLGGLPEPEPEPARPGRPAESAT